MWLPMQHTFSRNKTYDALAEGRFSNIRTYKRESSVSDTPLRLYEPQPLAEYMRAPVAAAVQNSFASNRHSAHVGDRRNPQLPSHLTTILTPAHHPSQEEGKYTLFCTG